VGDDGVVPDGEEGREGGGGGGRGGGGGAGAQHYVQDTSSEAPELALAHPPHGRGNVLQQTGGQEEPLRLRRDPVVEEGAQVGGGEGWGEAGGWAFRTSHRFRQQILMAFERR